MKAMHFTILTLLAFAQLTTVVLASPSPEPLPEEVEIAHNKPKDTSCTDKGGECTTSQCGRVQSESMQCPTGEHCCVLV
ncbi:hypothetical protein F5H01DRAFT_355351 [Linnemannia elongata]|nr:hypothetical protein F5H01DRAFT_355351 [Linnemannia elongata]